MPLINNTRRGVTLLELLVVMIIIATVYSIGIFALKKTNLTASSVSLGDLYHNLLSLSQSQTVTLACSIDDQQCYIIDQHGRGKPVNIMQKGKITAYAVNTKGDLINDESKIVSINGKRMLSDFKYTISANGIASRLILKHEGTYYAYSPLEETPYITTDEGVLREHLYDEHNYPTISDSYHGAP